MLNGYSMHRSRHLWFYEALLLIILDENRKARRAVKKGCNNKQTKDQFCQYHQYKLRWRLTVSYSRRARMEGVILGFILNKHETWSFNQRIDIKVNRVRTRERDMETEQWQCNVVIHIYYILYSWNNFNSKYMSKSRAYPKLEV